MKKISSLLFSIFFLTLASKAQIHFLTGSLQAKQVSTSIPSFGGGTIIVKYNAASQLVEWWGNFRSLTAPNSGVHIHGPASAGSTGPILFTLAAASSGTNGAFTGTATLTAGQEGDLLGGRMYVDVHSTGAYVTSGEIRAQLTPTTQGQSVFLNARLQGAQQVPPTSSTGTGMVNALVDKTTMMLYLTGNYSGLSFAAISAHIHRGAPGANGSVVTNSQFTTTSTGTIDTARAITPAEADSILNGNTYVDIHTFSNTGGEVRGQLSMLSQLRYFANPLTGAAEVPANTSTARGTVIVRYNTETNLFELVGDYQNLSAPITASHIHGPAAPGVNADVLFPLTNTGGTTGTLTGSATLTQAQEAELLAGNMYANVHSTTFPGGEIRAQVIPRTENQSHHFTATLQSSQEVPPVASPATGSATVLLDRATRLVFVTTRFSGLTSNIMAAHLHHGTAGTNGPVVVPLNFSGTTSGTVTGTGTVRATFADSMINGLTYVNIHTVTNPNGEIRAQLANLTLPVKLTYFNGYKDRNKIALLWETTQEIDVKNYEVEQQSLETGEWVKKATISATGGNAARKYRFDDIPVLGKKDYLLYRLKTVDADGKFVYSSIIRINYAQSKAGLTIMPNPVINNKIRFTITGMASEQKAEISVIDLGGRTMLKTAASTLLNNSIDISALSSGVYKLIIRMNNGTVLQENFSK